MYTNKEDMTRENIYALHKHADRDNTVIYSELLSISLSKVAVIYNKYI